MIQEEIIILNVLKYKKDDKSGCRLSFVYSDEDKFQVSDSYKGLTEISLFYKSDVFKKISPEIIFKPVIGTFEERKDFRNPLTTRLVLTKIETENDEIDLL